MPEWTDTAPPTMPLGQSPAQSAAAPSNQTQPEKHHSVPKWLERTERFLRVLVRIYLGVALCFLPWSRYFWDRNPLLLHFPQLSPWLHNGALRGVVSGLGVLNLWIALNVAFGHENGSPGNDAESNVKDAQR